MNAEQADKLETHDELLLGRNGEPGLAHKVNFMWRIHVWLLCGISGVGGFGFHWVIQTFGK